MSYDDKNICLYGDHAKEFLRNKIGDRVKITIDAVLIKTGIEDHMSMNSYEPEKSAVAEFEIVSVKGGKKSPDQMDASEIESEIADVMNNEQPIPKQPNLEDGGSIWVEKKQQEQLGKKPMKRVSAFVMR